MTDETINVLTRMAGSFRAIFNHAQIKLFL